MNRNKNDLLCRCGQYGNSFVLWNEIELIRNVSPRWSDMIFRLKKHRSGKSVGCKKCYSCRISVCKQRQNEHKSPTRINISPNWKFESLSKDIWKSFFNLHGDRKGIKNCTKLNKGTDLPNFFSRDDVINWLSYKENSLFPFDTGYTAISVRVNLHDRLTVCVQQQS